MNGDLVYNKNGILILTKKEEWNGVGTIWKNKYRYLLHTIMIPNELKSSTWKSKITRVLEGKMEKYFTGVRSS